MTLRVASLSMLTARSPIVKVYQEDPLHRTTTSFMICRSDQLSSHKYEKPSWLRQKVASAHVSLAARILKEIPANLTSKQRDRKTRNPALPQPSTEPQCSRYPFRGSIFALELALPKSTYSIKFLAMFSTARKSHRAIASQIRVRLSKEW